jgi:glutaconate CoA-transferase subunit B
MTFNAMELMICTAARSLDNGASVVVGTGGPCAAAMLAQKCHASELVILFEAGGVAPLLPTMPISVGDSRTTHQALMAASMPEIMETCQRGMIDYAFLGGAQIDMYGNLNSTQIGPDHMRPKVRFPGSGGANDLASLCWKTIVMTPMDARRFVPKVDFITSPGYLTGGKAREEAGLPPETGPHLVVTDKAVMDFEPYSKRMRVLSIHPAASRDQVQENCGFELLFAENVIDTATPTPEELAILRNEVDPHGYIIGR